MEAAASDKDVDIVVIATKRFHCLISSFSGNQGREKKKSPWPIKGALVMAGNIIIRGLKSSQARIIPVDGEQSAIFQCLEGRENSQVRRLYLTASGGALYDVPLKDFRSLRPGRSCNIPVGIWAGRLPWIRLP